MKKNKAIFILASVSMLLSACDKVSTEDSARTIACEGLSGCVAHFNFESAEQYQQGDLIPAGQVAFKEGYEIVPGIKGNAVSFKKGYVEITNPEFLTNQHGAVAFWMQARFLDKGHDGTLFAVNSGSSANEIYFIWRSRDKSYRFQTTFVMDKTVERNLVGLARSLKDTNWHHVVLMSDGNTVRHFIDGAEVSLAKARNKGAFSGKWFAANPGFKTVTIGALDRDKVSNYFFGSVDEFMVFNRPLSESEISKLAKINTPK